MSTKIRPANKYGRELCAAARDLGFTWRYDGQGHLCFEGHGATIRAPNTPRSEGLAFKQAMAKLRRAAAGTLPRSSIGHGDVGAAGGPAMR